MIKFKLTRRDIMFGKIGAIELILILMITLIVFGPSKLPLIGKAFGQAIGQFKSNVSKSEE
jgi:sec-independent protein translocase protein TatA